MWIDDVYECGEMTQAAALITSIQVQTSLCPKAFYKKLYHWHSKMKNMHQRLFPQKIIRSPNHSSVSSLLYFLALNLLPTFPSKDNWT